MYKKICKRFLQINLSCLLAIMILCKISELGVMDIVPANMAQKEMVWFDESTIGVDILQLADAKLPTYVSEKIEKVTTEKECYEVSEEDYHNLLCIVQAEAGGEDLEGKVLVGNVVMNRVKSEKFPDTITEVIFQKNEKTVQFSPTRKDTFTELEISEETKEAVNLVLAGTDYSQGALFFAARKRAKAESMSWFDTKLQYLFQHGGHEFYKVKEETVQ